MKGFTLLEVLVSISILAVVMASIYGAFTSNLESMQRADESRQAHQIARGVLNRMTIDLEAACLESHLPIEGVVLAMVGESRESPEGRAVDAIHFSTLTHLDLKGGKRTTDICNVGYFLEEDKEGEGFTLFRRDNPNPGDDPAEGGVLQELSTNVIGLDFTYHDFEGGVWERWDTREEEEPHAGRLPALISITLTIMTDQGRERVFKTTAHPRLAAPPDSAE